MVLQPSVHRLYSLRSKSWPTPDSPHQPPPEQRPVPPIRFVVADVIEHAIIGDGEQK